MMADENVPAIFEGAFEHDGIRIHVDVHARRSTVQGTIISTISPSSSTSSMGPASPSPQSSLSMSMQPMCADRAALAGQSFSSASM